MAKTSFDDWSTTASDNTDIGGISVQGSARASNMDNATREMMAQLAAFRDDLPNRFNIRQFGSWETGNTALVNTATLIAAYDALVTAGGGQVIIPGGTYYITAPEATRVALDEGACLIMDHTNGATIEFIGARGSTILKPASNKIEIFAKDGDFDFILDGIVFDNSENGILSLQVKPSGKTMNGGIAGLGNGANCVVRQYNGTGFVALRNCKIISFNTGQDHTGVDGDDSILEGDIEQTNVEFDDICFGLLCRQPKTITRNNIHGKNVIDAENGNNTDGTETDTTVVSTDPGHVLYVSNRPGAQIEHQSHVNLKTTGATSSGEKIRKGQNITFSNYSFLNTGRGMEIFNNYRATVTNISGAITTTSDSNQNAFELTDAGGCVLSNMIFDLGGVNAWGMRIRNEDAIATITGITAASPAVVTSTSHGLSTGDVVGFFEVVGMTQINGLQGTVTKIDNNSFSVNIDASAFSAYASGGYATITPWANRHNFISNVVVVQPHITPAGVTNNGKSAFIVVGQEDCTLNFPTQIHLGSAPGRAVVDLRACKRVKVFMPTKFAPNAPSNADRLVVLDSDCVDCTVVYDHTCLSVAATGNTVVDAGTNTKIVCLSGPQGKFSGGNGSASAPSFTFDSDPDTGLYRGGTNILAVTTAGTEVGRFTNSGYNPPSDGGSALGTSSLSFSRAHMQVMALVDGIAAPSAQAGRALIYVDTADGDLKVKFADGTTKTIATDT